MRTAGIDLATQPARSAVCTIDWTRSGALVRLVADRSDHSLIEVCRTADKVGIDCPLGWPESFVAALQAHQDGRPWPGRGEPPDPFRASLAWRATDRAVRDRTKGGCSPLSVAADRLGLTTMRCALLLDALGDVDRTGITGRVAEVYPAASLWTWGLPWSGYKGLAGRPLLATMLDQLERSMPWVQFAPGIRERVAHDDNAFDALICAITARAVTAGGTHHPGPGEQKRLAASEGWIHVPVPGAVCSIAGSHQAG